MPYVVCSERPFEANDYPLPMSMKKYKAAEWIPIRKITEKRQNLKHGSTLEVIFELRNTKMTYITAANMGIWPTNQDKDVSKC